MMFRAGSQLVFHTQLSRSRDAVPIVRDYMVDMQRRYENREASLPERQPGLAPNV